MISCERSYHPTTSDRPHFSPIPKGRNLPLFRLTSNYDRTEGITPLTPAQRLTSVKFINNAIASTNSHSLIKKRQTNNSAIAYINPPLITKIPYKSSPTHPVAPAKNANPDSTACVAHKLGQIPLLLYPQT